MRDSKWHQHSTRIALKFMQIHWSSYTPNPRRRLQSQLFLKVNQQPFVSPRAHQQYHQ